MGRAREDINGGKGRKTEGDRRVEGGAKADDGYPWKTIGGGERKGDYVTDSQRQTDRQTDRRTKK